jgi:hypothetical protein
MKAHKKNNFDTKHKLKEIAANLNNLNGPSSVIMRHLDFFQEWRNKRTLSTKTLGWFIAYFFGTL